MTFVCEQIIFATAYRQILKILIGGDLHSEMPTAAVPNMVAACRFLLSKK